MFVYLLAPSNIDQLIMWYTYPLYNYDSLTLYVRPVTPVQQTFKTFL